MTDDESFLLVNLKEDKAKELAQVIGSDSCRKILDYLAQKKKATESEISKELKIPLSTIHYNLQNLYKAGLVVAEEFHYSEKGKEVNHYSLAKKIIIIAPEEKSRFIDKLKKVLPLTVFAVVGAGLIQVYTWFSRNGFGKRTMLAGAEMKTAVYDTSFSDASATSMARTMEANSRALHSEPNIAFWFLVGSMTIILFILIMSLIKKK